MTTPTPDFCVSSQADGFDEFLKVLSEYCKTIGYLNGAHKYYGLSSGGLDCGSQAWTTNELTPHAAIALLTAKPLTEVCQSKLDGICLLPVGTCHQCAMTALGKLLPATQEESVKGEDEIRTHDTVVCGWNDEGELVYIRTFDVEPSEGIINDIEHKKAVKAFQWVNENLASSRMGDKCFLDLDPTNQTAHLQQQLKEAKEKAAYLQTMYDFVTTQKMEMEQQLKQAKELLQECSDKFLRYYHNQQIPEYKKIFEKLNQFLTPNK